MNIPITYFAPAERKSVGVIQLQAANLNRAPLAQTLLNAALNYLLVLNEQRQIVMASENILELVPDKTMDQIIGLRPGEALGCIHAHECESGCGTSQFCCQCAMVRVILMGLNGSRDVEECHLTRQVHGQEETLHLRGLATPLLYNNERYALLAIANVGLEQ